MSSSGIHLLTRFSNFIFSNEGFDTLMNLSPVPTEPQDVTMQSETILVSRHVKSPIESSSNACQYALPLDEYLNFGSDTSDEEMEGTTPGDDPSTTTTTLPPVSQRRKMRCLWQGCRAEFEAGTRYDVWKDHIKSVHTEQENEGGSRPPRAIKCHWDGCGRNFKRQGIMKHMTTHFRDA